MTGWQNISCYIMKYAIYLIFLSTLTKTDDFGTSAILGLQPHDSWPRLWCVGGQNNRIFSQRIYMYMKLGLSSQRREMFLFLTTKYTNDQHGRRNVTCKPAIIMSVLERCSSYCESTKRKKERQRPTLGVRYSEV